jgi:predicted ATPase
MITLRPKVFAVLAYLVTHAGQLVTKEMLFDAVWPETVVTDAVLKACIRELRRVLGDTIQTPQFIATVHRRGYRFIASVRSGTSTEDSRQWVGSTEQWPVGNHQPRPTIDRQPPEPIVEREGVLQQLHSWLTMAAQGRRQLVFITGEPGSGKTAVVEAFARQAAADSQVRLAWGQCVEYYGTGEAYMPVLEALGQLCRGVDGAQVVAELRQHAPTWLVQMPWLLGPADREVLQNELRGATRERMLRELAEAINALTVTKLLVLILEDLHWSDHATLDLLAVLARRREAARLLLLCTYRPVEVIVRAHPLHTLKQDLQIHGQCLDVPLAPLSEAGVAMYLARRFPDSFLSDELTQQLYQRTDGNPLFLVNMVEHLITQGLLVQHDGRWELRKEGPGIDVGVPENLWQMIVQQFDHLPPAEQRLVEVGSVAGVEFAASVLAACLDEDPSEVERRCEELARRRHVLQPVEVVEWPDGTITGRFAFQHALYRQVAYQRLGTSQRVYLHRRVGERLEMAYGQRALELAAELAEHFIRGREPYRAVQYLRQAAETALQRHAHREAIDHLRRALECLKTLPDTPERTPHELQVYLALGGPLMATRGQAALEVEEVYGQAYILCQQAEETDQLLPVLAGLWRFYAVRGVHHKAWELGERLLALAQRLSDQSYQLEAHRALGATLFFRGQLPAALDHLQQAMALYESGPSQVSHVLGDPQVSCLIYAARALWCLGYPDQARLQMQQAASLAQRLAHPYSLVWSQSFIADLYQLCGEDETALTLIESSLAMATAQGLPYWEARGRFMRGLVLAKQGHGAEGIAQMRQGLAAMQITGAGLNRAYFLAQLAEAYAQAGQSDIGLATVAEALELGDERGEHWWEAELHRLQGVLLLVSKGINDQVQPNSLRAAKAERCLQQALTMARRQQARALELRAVMSLSRLWRHQGRNAAARRLLVESYNWFTEGFDTADLQAARGLLDTLM